MIPFSAVMGIVSKKTTNRSENSRLTNLGLSGSIGFGFPFAVRHLLMRIMFQDAPMIRPYAKMVGAINVSIAAATHIGRIAAAPSLCELPYRTTANVAPDKISNVVNLRTNLTYPLDFPLEDRVPTSWAFNVSQGDMNTGIKIKTPIKKRFGRKYTSGSNKSSVMSRSTPVIPMT